MQPTIQGSRDPLRAVPGPESSLHAEREKAPLRVALFTNEFPGKVTTFIARDLRGLIETGIEIDLFAIRPYEEEMWRYVPSILDRGVFPRQRAHHMSLKESLRQLRPSRLTHTGRFLREAAAITRSAIGFGVEPTVKSAYVLPKAWAWAEQFRDRYDHVLSYWGNYCATCAYMFHRMIDRPIPFSMFLHAGMDLYNKRVFMRNKLLYADNIFVVCDFNRRYINEHYQDIARRIAHKIQIHHLGLPIGNMNYDPSGRQPGRILGVGRLTPQKGYAVLIKAVAELQRRNVHAEVQLIGEGPLERELRNLARERSVTDRVRFLGWKTFDEVQQAMREASIFAHPSPGIGDAVPTVIKESLALGTPVVGSRAAGIPELLNGGECGVLVDPGDVMGLADALQSLLANGAERGRLARQGRRFAEQTFDMWQNGEKLAERLRSSIRQGSQVQDH